MIAFSLLTDLCESRLITSKTALKTWKVSKLQQSAYLYFLAIRILLADEESAAWAKHYCAKTAQPNNFDHWRTDGNDFYVLLYALIGDAEINDNKSSVSSSAVRDWLRHVSHQDFTAQTQKLFNRLDAMFHVSDSALKSLRRLIGHWDAANEREQQDAVDKVVQRLKAIAPNSELLTHLKAISDNYNKNDEVTEGASSGATGAASVATVVGGLGAGFDQDYSKSIYHQKKTKKSQPAIIRR